MNASATNIPITDTKFDIITCLEAETYFEPLDKYCQQVVKLLKKRWLFNTLLSCLIY